MKNLEFNTMHNIEMSVEEVNRLLETDYVTVDKIWTDEDEFAASPEVKAIYEGWQARYHKVSEWKMKFLFGFSVNDRLFHTYIAEGLCITQHVSLNASPHNGGVNEINFIKCNGQLAYSINKNVYLDPAKMRRAKMDIPVVDGYHAAYL